MPASMIFTAAGDSSPAGGKGASGQVTGSGCFSGELGNRRAAEAGEAAVGR